MNIPFSVIDWDSVPKTLHPGETGTATWQTVSFEGLRIRKVCYSAGYKADHWCEKGHLIFCIKGSFDSELSDGTTHTLHEGMSYIVSDDLSSHRSTSENGVELYIVDGQFLSNDTTTIR